MPTLEDFQNILQNAEQERIQQSPLYQKVAQEQMREQQKMQEIPQELLPVFEELRGAQERNEVRNKLQRYNTAVQYCGGGCINRFDGVTGSSDMNTFIQMNPITGWQPQYYQDFGIGNHPAFDEDFRNRYGLRYAPYSEVDFNGVEPDNIRLPNQGNVTARAYNDPSATLLVGPDNRIINQQRLSELSNQYRKDNAQMLNRHYAKALSEKPLEPKAPEFYLLAGGAHALQNAANKGLTAMFVDPMMNMQMTDNFISNTTPYSGWGNLMSENVGGPEWAWDLAHPAFAKDLWNLTKAAGRGAYNWMAEHTPESAYSFGIRAENPAAALEPFNWDDFVRAGGYVDESMASNVSDDVIRAANASERTVANGTESSARTATGLSSGDRYEQQIQHLMATNGWGRAEAENEAAVGYLMRQYGLERDEAEILVQFDPNFDQATVASRIRTEAPSASGTGVEDLILPEPPSEINLSPDASEIIEQSAGTNSASRRGIFPRADEIDAYAASHPELDTDEVFEAVHSNLDPALFTNENRENLITDFMDANGVGRYRAETEVDQILNGTHPDIKIKGLVSDLEKSTPSYEEILKNPSLLDPYKSRLRYVHPNMGAGIPKEEMMRRYHDALKDFNQRPPLSTIEQLNTNFSGDSAKMILNNIYRKMLELSRAGKVPGIMKVEPSGTGYFRNHLNEYGKINWGTPEAPANRHLMSTSKDGVFEMPYTYYGAAPEDRFVTLEQVAEWPTAQQRASELNKALSKMYDLYAPYSEELRNFGKDNFKITLDTDNHQFYVPQISWVFKEGGPINTRFFNYPNIFAGGGKTNNEQLWNKARPLYNELTAAGVPHMAAIGVLGNIALESGVNPNASNKVNGRHWGYTQNDKAITDHIKKYYGGTGHEEQMQFLKDGLTGQIRGANQAKWLQKRFDEYRQSINGVNDPAKAALMWERYYEKSANEALDKRADYAKYFHDALGSPNYQYSQDKYNSRSNLGPLVSQTTEVKTPEQAPWYNRYQLNDADYAALYEQNNTPLPMFDTSLTWNPMQAAQQSNGFPNLFAGGGYIEDGLRSLGVNGFKVTSGYRGPNSKVGKAGKRSGHAHILKDGSSGAIDIVPTDKSPAGWARLEQQLRSPEVQQFLASFGGTILDERDAATMKKTGATGQHFHIGLGVKGSGNFYNQPATSTYAQRSPISVFSPIQSSTVDNGSYAPWYAKGSGMTDEDWAALYNIGAQQLIPTNNSGMFPQLV